MSLTTEETPDSYWYLKLPSPKEKGSFYPNCSSPADSCSGSEPQSAASSASTYQLLQHLEIRKRFTPGKTSQGMTFGEERFHSALPVSKPVLQKPDQNAPGLTGHVLGTRRSTVLRKKIACRVATDGLRRIGRTAPCSARSRCLYYQLQTGGFISTCTCRTQRAHLHSTAPAPHTLIHR